MDNQQSPNMHQSVPPAMTEEEYQEALNREYQKLLDARDAELARNARLSANNNGAYMNSGGYLNNLNQQSPYDTPVPMNHNPPSLDQYQQSYSPYVNNSLPLGSTYPCNNSAYLDNSQAYAGINYDNNYLISYNALLQQQQLMQQQQQQKLIEQLLLQQLLLQQQQQQLGGTYLKNQSLSYYSTNTPIKHIHNERVDDTTFQKSTNGASPAKTQK